MTGPSLEPPYLPVALTDVELAFPAHGLRLMPRIEDIERRPEWEDFANDWFMNGVDDIGLLPTKFLVENDHDPESAWRHLRGIMGSFEPSHQDKIAAVGFLLSTWFRWCRWTTTTGVTKEIGDSRVPK